MELAGAATTDATGAARDLEIEAAIAGHGRRCHGVIRAILGPTADAEDAWQASLERAWRSWASLRDPDRRGSWLASICAREALRLRRRVALRAHHSGETGDGCEEFVPGDPDLNRALQRLSPMQRAVVALHYGHGYTLDEVGEVLGRRGGTVRSHLARALTTLRGELSDER
jgi:RNA polymerase sigma factor (sigma-70 family)